MRGRWLNLFLIKSTSPNLHNYNVTLRREVLVPCYPYIKLSFEKKDSFFLYHLISFNKV